jgi:predicted RNase H-like nuclease
MTMKTVIGVDGAPGGWLAVVWGESVTHQLFQNLHDLVQLDAEIIAIDMPIGFPVLSGRKVEKIARQILKGKASSLFSVPARAAIENEKASYHEACQINLQHSEPPKKFSKQSFNIFPKMRELDRLMTPALQARVHEVHPELSFAEMNNRKAALTKKSTAEGRQERTKLLQASGFPWQHLKGPDYLKKHVAENDIVDACACAWTARRILDGRAFSIPDTPDRDARGLVMSITV